MNLFLIGYLGAFVKWTLHGFKTRYKDECNQTKLSKRVIKSVSIDTENLIFGYSISIVLILLLILGFGCSVGNNTDNYQNAVSDNSQSEITTENSMIISEKAVIFLFPDSLEIKKIREESDEETYNEIIADMTWYPSVARQSLNSLNINNFQCDKEYLIFIDSDNKEIPLKRKDISGDMIVFNPDKELLITHSIDYNKDSVLTHLK